MSKCLDKNTLSSLSSVSPSLFLSLAPSLFLSRSLSSETSSETLGQVYHTLRQRRFVRDALFVRHACTSISHASSETLRQRRSLRQRRLDASISPLILSSSTFIMLHQAHQPHHLLHTRVSTFLKISRASRSHARPDFTWNALKIMSGDLLWQCPFRLVQFC